MPILDIRIIPRWSEEASDLLIIRIEVENKWKVGLKKQEAFFQILEHHIPDSGALLSGWVPFAKDRILPNEEPIEWREPLKVLTSTKKVESKETIIIELLYRPKEQAALHCAFQFVGKLNILARILHMFGAGTDRWTRTIWITRNVD